MATRPMDDTDIDGSQPRCPDCKVTMRTIAAADVCPVCGHTTHFPEATAVARFDGPTILGG